MKWWFGRGPVAAGRDAVGNAIGNNSTVNVYNESRDPHPVVRLVTAVEKLLVETERIWKNNLRVSHTAAGTMLSDFNLEELAPVHRALAEIGEEARRTSALMPDYRAVVQEIREASVWVCRFCTEDFAPDEDGFVEMVYPKLTEQLRERVEEFTQAASQGRPAEPRPPVDREGWQWD